MRGGRHQRQRRRQRQQREYPRRRDAGDENRRRADRHRDHPVHDAREPQRRHDAHIGELADEDGRSVRQIEQRRIERGVGKRRRRGRGICPGDRLHRGKHFRRGLHLRIEMQTDERLHRRVDAGADHPAARRCLEPVREQLTAADLLGALEVRRLVGALIGRNRESQQQDGDDTEAQIGPRIGAGAGNSKGHVSQAQVRRALTRIAAW